MARQQPIRVVVEKKPSGCWSAFGFVLLIGLAIEYWYVSLAILAIVVVIALVRESHRRESTRHRPGPRDPWLNEVTVALSDLEFTETERNTGSQLGGAPVDGDIGLRAGTLKVYVNLFSDQRLARQAELGLRVKPEIRAAIANGRTAIRTEGRVVFVAKATGAVVDEYRVDEVVRLVARIALPPPLQPPRSGSGAGVASPDPDVLEQLRKLAELHRAGALTDAEFEAKKVELLGRV
jgi:Short C-terminal domain